MENEDIEVRVPPGSYGMSKDAAALWDLAGAVVSSAQRKLGRDMAFSVLLSRIARELRREVGTAGAKATLQGMVDTMDEAARYDRDD